MPASSKTQSSGAKRATTAEISPGDRFGRFVIHARLGSSPLGTAYLAEEPSRTRQVTLKILAREFTTVPGFAPYLKKLAQRIIQLEHPNLVPLYRVGKSLDHIFLAHGYFPPPRKPSGATLATMLAEAPLTPARALAVLEDLVPALTYLHRQGLVHQNLKPTNVIFDDGGRAHLTDCGMAPLLEAALQTFSAGERAGTPAYMSPEELNGKKVDALSDQYSLAALLYHMLTGQPPFAAASLRDLFMQQYTLPVPSVSAANPAVPASLDPIMARALSFSRGARYPDLAELLEAVGESVRAMAVGPAEVEVPVTEELPEGIAPVEAAPLPPLEPELAAEEAVTPAEPELAAGTRVYRFVIQETIERGPAGVLYRAAEPSQKREVGLRILRPEFSEVPSLVPYLRQLANRFSQLRHPRLIPLYRAGQAGGRIYIASGYAPGGSLKDRLAGEVIPADEALQIIGQIAPALEYLHDQNIVHLDIKPSSILFDEEGACLGTVGLTPTLEAAARTFLPSDQAADPRYKPPEELAGRKTDPRSDQYSLAVILFELLTGRTPYEAADAEALFMAQYAEPVPSLRQFNREIPVELDAAIGKALSYTRGQRYESVGQMLEALTGVITVRPRVVDAPPEPVKKAALEFPAPSLPPQVEAVLAAAPAALAPPPPVPVPVPAVPPAAPPVPAPPPVRRVPARVFGLPASLFAALAALVAIPAVLAAGALLGNALGLISIGGGGAAGPVGTSAGATATARVIALAATDLASAPFTPTATLSPTLPLILAPSPTFTITPEPTETPSPTATPSPAPTATPAETASPTSSPTPEPTEAPTATPVPTLSPTPAPTSTPVPTATPGQATLQGVAIQIIDLTNQQRANSGLEPLIRMADLEEIAFARSEDMAQRHYFSHYDPLTGEALIYPMTDAAGYAGAVGENLGRSNGVSLEGLPPRVVSSWMGSSLHRGNILDSGFTMVGVGLAYDQQNSTWVVTQVLAGPTP